jgi:hypothetical protein
MELERKMSAGKEVAGGPSLASGQTVKLCQNPMILSSVWCVLKS